MKMNPEHIAVFAIIFLKSVTVHGEDEIIIANATLKLEAYNEERRSWCPPANNILPCTCDGPPNFLLFTCDRIENAYIITRVTRGIDGMRNFGKFSLTNSRLSNLETNMLGFLSFEYIYARKNTIKVVESVFFESSRDSLKRIELVHNDIEKFPFKELATFPKLEYIDLKYNSLKKLPDEAFGNVVNTKMKKVDLSFNKINHVGSNAFRYLTNLELIDLRHNRLTVINNLAFSGNQVNAKLHLNLARNKIMFISVGAFSNQVFKNLNLTGNNLRKLSENVFRGTLKNMAERQTGIISVYQNRFTCTCNDAEWIVRLPSFYKARINGMQCQDHNNMKIQELTLNDVVCQIKA